jgi:hypothetical protein
MALLNFAKAIRELENIDMTQLQKIIELQKLLSVTEQGKIEKQNPPMAQSGSELDRGVNLAENRSF